MTTHQLSDQFLAELRQIVGDANVMTPSPRLDRNSRDCYWYSPILKAQLDHMQADVLVQPATTAEVTAVVAAAVRARIPITPRGAGTGNYGQSIPIHGGLLISTRRMTNILELTADFVRAEAGVILHTIESEARKIGAELRFFPSTLPTATLAGFIAGGSAGPGSIKWGNVWDEGNVLGATIVTIEEDPQTIILSDPEQLQSIIHNCGLSAIITEIKLALAPAERWQQYVVAFENFDDALRAGYELAFDDQLPTRLVSCIQWPAPSYFVQLAKAGGCPDGHAILLLHLTLHHEEVVARMQTAGGRVTWHSPHASLHTGGAIELTDFSWNHTTLWAIKHDPTITYLQEAFHPEKVFDQLAERRAKYGESLIEHITFSRSGGRLRPSSLALVRFTSAEHLHELMAFCESIGIEEYSPHTTYLDDDQRWDGRALLAAKRKWDPHNLLNPGHLRQEEDAS